MNYTFIEYYTCESTSCAKTRIVLSGTLGKKTLESACRKAHKIVMKYLRERFGESREDKGWHISHKEWEDGPSKIQMMYFSIDHLSGHAQRAFKLIVKEWN